MLLSKITSRYTPISFPCIIFSVLLIGLCRPAVPLAGVDAATVKAQNSINETVDTIDIYLDCQTRGCYTEYIRNEVRYVNYVRDQEDADIHLRINRETAGSGREYTLNYFGQGIFAGRENQIRFFSSDNDTDDERRQKLVRYLQLGLVPYLQDTELVDRIHLNVDPLDEDPEADNQFTTDGWNFWVFEIGGRTSFRGSQTRESFSLDSEFSADRITHDWKIRMEIEGEYEYNWFELSDGRTTTTEVRDQSFEGLFARAVSPHWSIGLYTEAESSTYDNYDMRLAASPAVEYNFFDYEEYGERELRLMYRMTPSYTRYIEETIYQQTAETLFNHQLSLDIDFNRRWGRVRGSVSTSHYLHDFDMNRLEFFTRLDLRLYRGLSLNLIGSYDFISDQLAIPAEGATDEEVLLDIRQQATDFSYFGRIGLSYTFGSIYNNIVNPRF